MTPLDKRIEPLLAGMSDDPRLPAGAEESIRQAIAGSPFLSRLIANAATNQQIGRIAISYGEKNAGHFQDGEDGKPGTIYLSASTFNLWVGNPRISVLTEILGHETMHGILTEHRAQALTQFSYSYRDAMDAAYRSRDETVDLTGPVRTYLDRARQEEAMAEVTGLRALSSRIAQENPTATPIEREHALIAESSSRCIDKAGDSRRFAPGLSYHALSERHPDTEEHLTKAVEKCFHDGKGSLGKHGDSDYRNYYGVAPISSVAQDYAHQAKGRQPPEVHIDLRELGLDPRQLERNGLHLGDAKVFPIVDFGKNGFGRIELNNTGSTLEKSGSQPNRALAGDSTTPLSPADQTLLDQIRDKVGELDKANGRHFDAASERMSASLLAAAKDAGLTRADHVLLSNQTPTLPAAHNLFVVQGDPANPASLRAHVPTAEAAQRPVQDSLDQVTAIGQRQAQEQTQDLQQTQERQQRAASPSL